MEARAVSLNGIDRLRHYFLSTFLNTDDTDFTESHGNFFNKLSLSVLSVNSVYQIERSYF